MMLLRTLLVVRRRLSMYMSETAFRSMSGTTRSWKTLRRASSDCLATRIPCHPVTMSTAPSSATRSDSRVPIFMRVSITRLPSSGPHPGYRPFFKSFQFVKTSASPPRTTVG